MNEVNEGEGSRREPPLERVERPATAAAPAEVVEGRAAMRPPVYNYVLAVESPEIEPGLTVREFALLFVRSWWIIALVTAACLGFAVVSLLEATPLYTATMVVKSAEDQLATNTLPNDSEGLLTILGLGEGTPTTVSTFDVYLNALTSVKLAQRLEDKFALLKRLFADEWDEETQAWRAPSYATEGLRARVRGFFGLPVWAPPSAVTLTDQLAGITQTPASTPGLMILEYSDKDPEYALWFLRTVVTETDEMLREHAREELSANIDYVLGKLLEVQLTEYRAVFLQLQAQLETSLMLIRSNASYATEILDGPYVSDLPTSPKVTQTIAVAGAVGISLGLLLVVFIHLLRSGRQSER